MKGTKIEVHIETGIIFTEEVNKLLQFEKIVEVRRIPFEVDCTSYELVLKGTVEDFRKFYCTSSNSLFGYSIGRYFGWVDYKKEELEIYFKELKIWEKVGTILLRCCEHHFNWKIFDILFEEKFNIEVKMVETENFSTHIQLEGTKRNLMNLVSHFSYTEWYFYKIGSTFEWLDEEDYLEEYKSQIIVEVTAPIS